MGPARQESRIDPRAAPPGRGVATPWAMGLFFGSGALALVYELCWLRIISLHLGSTAIAVSVVLGVFMGGLALGAAVASRRADRIRKPLTRYGQIEMGIAVYAAASPALFAGVLPGRGLWSALGDGHLWLIGLIRLAVVCVLLLPPTMLMGATLPILGRFYALRRGEGGRGAGLLYGLNTVGAFLGTILAGFVLLPSLGLRRTLLGAAALNVILSLVALGVARFRELAAPDSPETPSAASKMDAQPQRMLSLAVGLAGFSFMACEVIWARVLTLCLGASVYAFTTVLAIVLVGLGTGAAVSAAINRQATARFVFCVLALSSALALCVTGALFPRLPELFLWLFAKWSLAQRFGAAIGVQVLLSSLVILLPALLMGGLLPAALRAAIRRDERTGADSGRLYAWNTVGDIVGASVGGLVLIPFIGIRGALILASVVLCGAAVAAATEVEPAQRSTVRAGAVLVAVGVALLTPAWPKQVMTLGVYAYAPALSQHRDLDTAAAEWPLLFYRDGLTATVTVSDYTEKTRRLQINGKTDGSDRGDLDTQRLLAHYPLLLHPEPANVCVIGMGTGCTAGSAALHEAVRRVTVVELERAVVEAARLFKHVNHDVHNHPKVDIRVADGRFYLNAHPDAFDVIISEPSNPWQAGSADLFTLEYFRRGAAALRQGGIFCQWLQAYRVSTDNLRSILNAFGRVFEHAYVVSPSLNDLLILGSRQPLPLDLRRLSGRIAASKALQNDLLHPDVDVRSANELLVRFRVGPHRFQDLVGPDAELHTDDLPIVAYRGPRELYRSSGAEIRQWIGRSADGAAPYLEDYPDPGAEGRRGFLLRLAEKYRQLYGPESAEAAAAERVAGAPRGSTDRDLSFMMRRRATQWSGS